MVSGNKIAGLLIAVTIAAALLGPTISAVSDNTGSVDVSNETLTTELDEWQSLDGFNIVDNSETIEYDAGSGWTEATSGDDYQLNNSAGEVQILGNGSISDGDDVRAAYSYEATNETTTTVAGLIPLFFVLLILVYLSRPLMDGL